ncbi:MAG: formylmethanofuran--tetrahydromethanopterin N-formyltransferase [Promethearchaeota archaeon]
MEIEDTYCEAFDGVGIQITVTAANEDLVRYAAQSFVALPSSVFGDAEGGIVQWLDGTGTPDGRPGATCQLWVLGTGKKAVDRLYDRLGRRLRQGILVVPTTAVYNALPGSTVDGIFDLMDNVGHCGDGYEEVLVEEGTYRQVISIPIMMGHDFVVEKTIPYKSGVMGGFFWFMCDSVESGLAVGTRAVEAARELPDVANIFEVCSAGSKVETNYPEIGATTNHRLCPTLKGKVADSLVPDGVLSIPELVMNAFSEETLRKAMRHVVDAVADVPGLVKVTSGNFGGKLGKYKIPLSEL